jgi:hypothetical protein
VGKTNLSGNDKCSSLNWKVFSQRNISKHSTGTTRSFFPVRVHRTTGRCHLSHCPLPKTRCAQAQNEALALGAYVTPFSIFPYGVLRPQ